MPRPSISLRILAIFSGFLLAPWLLTGCGSAASLSETADALDAQAIEAEPVSLAHWEKLAGEETDAASATTSSEEVVLLSEMELNRPIELDEVTEMQSVIALDKWTGQVRWQRLRDSDHSYSTPIFIHHYDVPQIISVGGRGVASYHPETGQEYWWCRHDGHSVVPAPVYGNGLVYVCTGYNTPSLLAIDPSGQGDVTDTHVRWRVEKGVPFNASPLLVDTLLFLISDVGVLTCYDALSGDLLWQQRLRGRYSSSPIVADGKLYVTSDDGVTSIIQPGEKFQLLGTCALEGYVQASPAVSGNALLMRTETHLFRIGEPDSPTEMNSTSRMDWPQFRGPTGQGHAGEAKLPVAWDDATNLVWRSEIPGRGWSSPVVQGERIWLTTAIEEESGAVQLQALCLDRRGGEVLHKTNVLRKLHLQAMHPRSSHATPTPVIDGDRVYVHFGAHVTACLNQEGRILWRTQVRYHHHHGPASSPIVVGDVVVMNCDGYDGLYDIEGARARGEKEPE